MKNSQALPRKNATIGDAAVDGLLAGVAAGVAMAAYLVATAFIGGEGLAILGRFDPNAQSPVVGLLMHLAVAGVYGTLFGIGSKFIRLGRIPRWLAGIVYGLMLLVPAETMILRASNVPLRAVPIWHFAIAHAVYGLVLGYLMGRVK